MSTRSIPATNLRCAIAILGISLGIACCGELAYAGGGNILPPTAKPLGLSLKDMAKALAYFYTSNNDPKYLEPPNFFPPPRFQVLYADRADPAGANTFKVKTGTKFFVPVAFVSDSPPILGDFPEHSSDAPDYIFSQEQLGGHDLEIEVDGKITSLGPRYVAGPVFKPNLLGGGGSHLIQIGAFLTPLSKGTHTVTIRGTFDGKVFDDLGFVFEFEHTYTVIVD